MMRVTEDTIWKWLNTKKPRPTPEYMKLLMDLLHEKYKEKKPHIRLSPELREKMQSMVGKIPDSQIAVEFGISRYTVQAERYKLGIKKNNIKPGEWKAEYDEEFIAALGTDSDVEIAKRFGYAQSSVARIRSKFGIPPYNGPRKPRKPRAAEQKPRKKYERRSPTKQYDKELINMLGREPDSKIAEKFNYSRAAIALIRKNRGIPSFRASRFSSEQLAEMQSMLGKYHDSEIAKKFNISNVTVKKIREATGIKPCRGKRTKTEERNKFLIPLLGTLSDKDLAEKAGLSEFTISYLRRKLNIPAFGGRGRPMKNSTSRPDDRN